MSLLRTATRYEKAVGEKNASIDMMALVGILYQL